jgi:RNA polymerase sigma-70 factor, ECF subfamily
MHLGSEEDLHNVNDAGIIFMRAVAPATAADERTTGAASAARWHDALVAAHEAAAQIWAPVALSLDLYVGHLGACVAAGGFGPAADPAAAPTEVLKKLHTTDLYLACAAGHDVPGATDLFVRHFLGPIAGAVLAINRDPGLVDEVRQGLHERLLLGTDQPPRILQYGGRASLATWLGVAAQRMALELVRADGARQRATLRASHEPLPLELDPELGYLKSRYSGAFKEALTVAIGRLPQRQRTVMRLHTVGGLTLQRIATMLRVDESTISRWVQRAREAILQETQRELGIRLGIRVAEVPSIARLVTSQIDVSVARLLGDDEAPPSGIKNS